MTLEERIDRMQANLEELAGKVHRAASKDDARNYVASVLAGRTAVASNAPFLADCGITELPSVTSSAAR